jgi:hypothetical protein
MKHKKRNFTNRLSRMVIHFDTKTVINIRVYKEKHHFLKENIENV